MRLNRHASLGVHRFRRLGVLQLGICVCLRHIKHKIIRFKSDYNVLQVCLFKLLLKVKRSMFIEYGHLDYHRLSQI